MALIEIRFLCRLLDDIEKTRIANDNRADSITRIMGVPASVAIPHFYDLTIQIAKIEQDTIKLIEEVWKEHPLAEWQNNYLGLGAKSAARLISIIDDPTIGTVGYWENEGEPNRRWVITGVFQRNIGKLWAYCGIGDPERTLYPSISQEDMLRLGNPYAKKQVWVITNSLVRLAGPTEKRNSPPSILRAHYEFVKNKNEKAVHDKICVRCGSKGKPAQIGSPLSDGHKDGRARRETGKEFLRHLWIAADEIKRKLGVPTISFNPVVVKLFESRGISKSIPETIAVTSEASTESKSRVHTPDTIPRTRTKPTTGTFISELEVIEVVEASATSESRGQAPVIILEKPIVSAKSISVTLVKDSIIKPKLKRPPQSIIIAPVEDAINYSESKRSTRSDATTTKTIMPKRLRNPSPTR